MNILRNSYCLSTYLKFISFNRPEVFVLAFTRPFIFNLILCRPLSTVYQLCQDGISYSSANLSRRVPCDFGPTAEKHIYHLLYLVSFPVLRRKHPCDCAGDIISSIQIHFDEYLDSHVPYYNLLSARDFSINLKRSLHLVKMFSYIPKILNVKNYSTNGEINPTSNGSLVELVQYYDSLPHLFFNTSQNANLSFSCCKQLYHGVDSNLCPDIFIRDVNGMLSTCNPSSMVFQTFICREWSYDIPQKFATNQVSNAHLVHLYNKTEDSTLLSFGKMLDEKKQILRAGDVSLLKNTKHMAGLVWWILIGEMEEFGGLEYFLIWSSNSEEYYIKNYVSELYHLFFNTN